MSLKLECLKLTFPSIDLLETRQLLGGSGNGYINENGEWDLGQLDEANVRPNDEDRYDDHREYEDHDGEDYSYDGNDGGPGEQNPNGDSSNSGNLPIGNPHNPSAFPVGEPQATEGMCLSSVIAQVLQYFGISTSQMTVALELIKANIGSIEQLTFEGLETGDAVKALQYYFNIQQTVGIDAINNALNNSNVIFATIQYEHGGGHAIVINNYDNVKETCTYYNPETAEFETISIYDIRNAYEIVDFSQDYKENYEREVDERAKESGQKELTTPDYP